MILVLGTFVLLSINDACTTYEKINGDLVNRNAREPCLSLEVGHGSFRQLPKLNFSAAPSRHIDLTMIYCTKFY